MKKILLAIVGSGSALGLLIFIYTHSHSYEKDLAAVARIEINAIKIWQQQGGLRQTLALGSSGEEVKLLQRALAADEQFAFNSEATGYYGAVTSQAIKTFQRLHGLPETGTVGNLTLEKVNNLYFNELCPQSGEYNDPDRMFTRIDKIHGLPQGYIPDNLINITGQVKTIGIACLRKEAADELVTMFNDARNENIHLVVTSSFRREEIQKLLHDFWLNYNYEENIDKIATPLHSEHQLGTAVDLSGISIGNSSVDPDFAHSAEGLWLESHAYQYGFIQSYPNGKKDITGYDYEPWHYRYVGKDNALKIKNKELTITQFFNSKQKSSKDKKKDKESKNIVE